MAIAGGRVHYTITVGYSFLLDTDLQAVNLGAGGSLTIQGAGQTILGVRVWPGFAGVTALTDGAFV